MKRAITSRSHRCRRLTVVGWVCCTALVGAPAAAWGAAPSTSAGYDETGQYGLLAATGSGGPSKPSGPVGKPSGAVAAATAASGNLPFTGLNIDWLLLGGATTVAAGALLRRFGSRDGR